jgi:glycine oxidase
MSGEKMTDCLIVGGGLIGLLTARELASHGLAVTLIDRRLTGKESSWAGGGILSPLYPWRYPAPVTALANWSQHHYPSLAEQLLQETGINPEYTQNGLLILDPEDAHRATEWSPESHQPVIQLEKPEVQDCEPNLQTPSTDAIWLPQVAQIRNPRLVKALRQSIDSRVRVIENNPVKQILVRQGVATAVETGQGKMTAGTIIVCAGAWTGNLLNGTTSAPEIHPVLGQMILFRAAPGLIRRIVLHDNHYLIPRRDGRVLVGSTLEEREFNKQTTDSAREFLRNFAIDHFPQLADSPIEHHWAGLRPSSPHGIPYIGAVPEVKNLYVNAGQFRNGVVLGPASARLCTDLVLGNTQPSISPEPFALQSAR